MRENQFTSRDLTSWPQINRPYFYKLCASLKPFKEPNEICCDDSLVSAF